MPICAKNYSKVLWFYYLFRKSYWVVLFPFVGKRRQKLGWEIFSNLFKMREPIFRNPFPSSLSLPTLHPPPAVHLPNFVPQYNELKVLIWHNLYQILWEAGQISPGRSNLCIYGILWSDSHVSASLFSAALYWCGYSAAAQNG